MTQAEILNGLREVAREHLDYEGPLRPDMSLVEAMELDSVRRLTLVVEVENRFDLCLEEDDEQGLETVADLVAVLHKRLTDVAP